MSDTDWPVKPQRLVRTFKKKRDYSTCEMKIKALISCVVTAQLFCIIVFA